MIRIREVWNEHKAHRAEKRRQRVWDAVNFEDTVNAWQAARTRAAVEREMQLGQLSQWDVPDDPA